MAVNSVTLPGVLHNLHGPERNFTRRRETLTRFLDAARGGFGAFNEFNAKDNAFFLAEAKKRGLRVYRFGEDGLVWDPSKLAAGHARVKKISQGGHVGVDETSKGPDNRRLGPSRFGIYVPFHVYDVDLNTEIDVTHPLARAFTVERWRKPVFLRSIASLAAGVLAPEGLMLGDMNSPSFIDLPGVADVPIKRPRTYEMGNYDQIFKWGKHIEVTQVRALDTPSDHPMLVFKVTFYRDGSTPSVPSPTSPSVHTTPTSHSLPRPGDSSVNWRRQGAPVAHPWAKRSTAWKRRHKKLWNKISRWQSAYRRRL